MKFNKRKLEYGTASALFIVLFIAVVIVINIFADFLTDRFSLKLDMTEEGQYSLSDETKTMLKGLSGDVSIYILSNRADMEKSELAKSTLETVQRYNSESGGRVKYEFVDPEKNPQFFKKYPKARNCEKRALVIEGPERYLVVESAEFVYNYGKNNKIYNEGEEKISSAILHVSSPEVAAAGFVKGHGETPPDALDAIFASNHFDVNYEVDLLSGVPENITNLVISAPTADFTADEIKNLEKYLGRDGSNLYVFWSIGTPNLPVLERYLSEWGLGFPSYVVCDEKNSYMSPNVVLATLSDKTIIDSELQGQSAILAPQSRPVELLWAEKGFTATNAFVLTSNNAYAKLISADKTISSFEREAGDIGGEFNVAAVSLRRLGNSGNDGKAQVFAFGSELFAAESITSISRAFNSELITRTVQYANPNTSTMKIAPKVTSKYDLGVTENGVRVLTTVLCGILPAFIIALAVYIFIKRKNK